MPQALFLHNLNSALVTGLYYFLMVTVVNSPGGESNSGMGMVLVVVLLIVLILALLFWGGPIFRRFGTGGDTQVPPNVDINVNEGPESVMQENTTEQTSSPENPVPTTTESEATPVATTSPSL